MERSRKTKSLRRTAQALIFLILAALSFLAGMLLRHFTMQRDAVPAPPPPAEVTETAAPPTPGIDPSDAPAPTP